MAFCTNCGAALREGVRFCEECGEKIETKTAEQKAAPAPVSVPKPEPKPEPKEEPKKSSEKKSPTPKKHRGLTFLLAVIFVVEFCVAGFGFPGFLRTKNTPVVPFVPGNGTGTSPSGDDSYEKALAAELPLMPETSLTNPRFIGVSVSEQEIAAVSPQCAAVSPEVPAVAFGDGVSVDLGLYNLTGDDTLEYRPLGSRSDDKNDLILYDFSLSSGVHTFPTDVTITLPRTAGDKAGSVVYYNPESGLFEPLAYEVSPDGLSYTVYIDHFSTVAETVSKYLTRPTSTGEYLNVFSVQKTDENGDPYPYLLQPVVFNDEDAARLFTADNGMLEQILNAGGISPEALINKDFAIFGKLESNADVANTIVGADPAVGVFNTLYGTDYKLTSAGKETLGKTFSAVSAAISLGSVAYQLWNNPDKLAVLKQSGTQLDLVSGTAAAVGVFAAGTVGAVCTAVGLAAFISAPVIDYVENDHCDTFEEEVYRAYLSESSFDKNGVKLSLDGKGFAKAVRSIADADKNAPDKLNADMTALYNGYIEHFWVDMTSAERAAYARDYYKRTYDPTVSCGWNEPDEEKSAYYMKRASDIVYTNTQAAVYAVTKTLLHESQKLIKAEIHDIVLPYLNTILNFEVDDTGLESGQRFSMSVYAENETYKNADVFDPQHPFSYPGDAWEEYDPDELPIDFADQKPVQFYPANMDATAFSRYRFVPHSESNSDHIFYCRMYYYLMIGAPKTLLFRGDGTELNPPIPVTFTIPEKTVRDMKTVKVTLDRKPAEEETGETHSGRYAEPIELDLYINRANFGESMYMRYQPYGDEKAHLSVKPNGDYTITLPPLDGVSGTYVYSKLDDGTIQTAYHYSDLSVTGFTFSGNLYSIGENDNDRSRLETSNGRTHAEPIDGTVSPETIRVSYVCTGQEWDSGKSVEFSPRSISRSLTPYSDYDPSADYFDQWSNHDIAIPDCSIEYSPGKGTCEIDLSIPAHTVRTVNDKTSEDSIRIVYELSAEKEGE